MEKSVVEKPVAAFSCAPCDRQFKSEASLRMHTLRVHLGMKAGGARPDNEPGIPCDQCGQLFKNQTSLNTHIRRIHSEQPTEVAPKSYNEHGDFECPTCRAHSISRSGIATHMRLHHGSAAGAAQIPNLAPTTAVQRTRTHHINGVNNGKNYLTLDDIETLARPFLEVAPAAYAQGARDGYAQSTRDFLSLIQKFLGSK